MLQQLINNDRTCAICRFRKGWSSLRMGTRHSKTHIQRLWRLAIDNPPLRTRDAAHRAQKRAREQLIRHGFHAKRRCTLLDHAKKILVRDPVIQRESLFASVIFNDLLHWELNCCDYAISAILGVMSKSMRLECDNNARMLPVFRNPDGSGIRKFNQVSAVTYLTTARRLSLMFVWVHVLGTGALMLPEPCRRPALVMFASMQTMILTAQGRRAYSVREWTRVYVDIARQFFGSMEVLMDYKEKNDQSANATPFERVPRYAYVHIYEYCLISNHICLYMCTYMNVDIFDIICSCNLLNHILVLIYGCAYMYTNVLTKYIHTHVIHVGVISKGIPNLKRILMVMVARIPNCKDLVISNFHKKESLFPEQLKWAGHTYICTILAPQKQHTK